jgi:hypothetical protein
LDFNPLRAELNPICHLLALLGAHHIFHVSGLKVNLRKKIVKYYILSIALRGAETWTLWRIDQKYLEKFKCSFGEGRR